LDNNNLEGNMGKLNVGGGLSGAGTGAKYGAAAGSLIPGVGTVIGSGLGALVGGFAGLFGKKKKKKKPKQLSTLDKKQQALNDAQHESILGGKGPLADLYNYNPEQANSVFDKTIANPAYRGFKENTVPGITGAFRKQGLQNSSYVGDSLSKAGRDVQESLDAQRSKYLYDTEQSSKTSKQNAVENLQNRQTFNYENQGQGSGGSSSKGVDWGSILKNEDLQNVVKDIFK
jgi:hypothetical protein